MPKMGRMSGHGDTIWILPYGFAVPGWTLSLNGRDTFSNAYVNKCWDRALVGRCVWVGVSCVTIRLNRIGFLVEETIWKFWLDIHFPSNILV